MSRRQGKDGIGEALNEREVMENTQDGARIATGFLFEHGQNPLGKGCVKLRYRFVGKNHFGLLHKRARNGNTLLFAPGQATDQSVTVVAEM
jgi:hypothetical protein